MPPWLCSLDCHRALQQIGRAHGELENATNDIQGKTGRFSESQEVRIRAHLDDIKDLVSLLSMQILDIEDPPSKEAKIKQLENERSDLCKACDTLSVKKQEELAALQIKLEKSEALSTVRSEALEIRLNEAQTKITELEATVEKQRMLLAISESTTSDVNNRQARSHSAISNSIQEQMLEVLMDAASGIKQEEQLKKAARERILALGEEHLDRILKDTNENLVQTLDRKEKQHPDQGTGGSQVMPAFTPATTESGELEPEEGNNTVANESLHGEESNDQQNKKGAFRYCPQCKKKSFTGHGHTYCYNCEW